MDHNSNGQEIRHDGSWSTGEDDFGVALRLFDKIMN